MRHLKWKSVVPVLIFIIVLVHFQGQRLEDEDPEWYLSPELRRRNLEAAIKDMPIPRFVEWKGKITCQMRGFGQFNPQQNLSVDRSKKKHVTDWQKIENVFVMETSNSTLGFRYRDMNWCGLESLAKIHHEATVNFYTYFHEFQDYNQDVKVIFKLLSLKYPNLNIEKRDAIKDSQGTPAERYFSSGFAEDSSRGSRSDLKTLDYSNILRWTYLWKYGGLYADMDVLALDRIPSYLPKNFLYQGLAGEKLPKDMPGRKVQNGFARFEKGHCFLESFLKMIGQDFERLSPIENNFGQDAINKWMWKFQKGQENFELHSKDFHLCQYSDDPVVTGSCSRPYPELATLHSKYVPGSTCAVLDPDQGAEIHQYIQDSDGLAFHSFNVLERSFTILQAHKDCAMMRIARRVCPVFYEYRMKQRDRIERYKAEN